MNIHQVLLVPGFGHSDDRGEYDRGQSAGTIAEVDVIDTYLPALQDELDCCGIRYSVMDTRSRPGIAAAERHLHVEAHSLVVHCLAGWYEKRAPKAKNVTHVNYGESQSFPLADELAEAVGQWGHCYVFGHKTANPRQTKDPLLSVPMTKAISIEPFYLNGPDVQEYLRGLEQLGVVIARALADHLGSRGHARVDGSVISPTPP